VTVVAHELRESGGQEKVTLRLVEGLLARGWAVRVIARRADCQAHEALRVIRVRGPRRPALAGFLWFFAVGGLVTALRRRGVVYANGIAVPNRVDVATVHFCHSGFERARRRHGFRRSSKTGVAYRLNELVGSAIFRAAERLLYRPSRRGTLVAVSDGLAEELAAAFPRLAGRIAVVPNGVGLDRLAPSRDARRLREAAHGELVALFVGGDWERKGLALAIEAVAVCPGWRLWVVGPGDVERYRALADSHGAGEQVIFLGGRDDTAPFYAAADALVFPSAYEACPLVALEAAAAGLPLVLTPVSGIAERIVSGENGFVVPRDADRIADCLEALRDPALRSRLGEAARRLAQEYDWPSVVDEYDRLLHGAIALGHARFRPGLSVDAG
jgi:glycosyltransferase involved in cell wall biosynthesis